MPAAKRAPTSTAKSKSSPKSKASGSSAAGSRSTAATGRAAAPKRAAAAKPAAAKTPSKRTAASKTTAAKAPSKSTTPRSSRAARSVKPANGGVISIAEQVALGSVSPREIVMLTREHIQDTLDDAASRGRMTRQDANELVAELVRRGRSGGDDVRTEIEDLLDKSRKQIGSATKRAVRSEPVDRIVRGADRARRAAGVGSSFPISGYSDLKVAQVQARLKELSKPELRKVLSYERKNANRKSVVGAIEKSL